MKFVIIASAFSGNKGAAAMLESSIQSLSEYYAEAEFTLLSVYPKEDRKLNSFSNLKILSATPVFLALILNPAALLARLVPKLRGLLCRWITQLDSLDKADVLLDQGGITFTDGREIFLLYNVATILPALLMGVKIVKCAQALGPFEKPINRYVAKRILPRINLIIARGEITFAYLKSLGLKNIVLATDYAFACKITPAAEAEAKRILHTSKTVFNNNARMNIGISPSIVIKKKCDRAGIDYIALMCWLINDLHQKNYVTTLIPHSARVNTHKTHNNDLPLCRAIMAGIKNPELCLFNDAELKPQVLRYMIAQTDLFITCRFHAMISSLAMGIPTLVLGWSHKYREILDLFKIPECGLDVLSLNEQALSTSFTFLLENRQIMAAKLRENFAIAHGLALNHIKFIDAVINASSLSK